MIHDRNKSEKNSSCDDNIEITSYDDDDERRFNFSHMICSLNSSFENYLTLITNSSKLKIKFTNTSNNNNHIGLKLYLNSYDKGTSKLLFILHNVPFQFMWNVFSSEKQNTD